MVRQCLLAVLAAVALSLGPAQAQSQAGPAALVIDMQLVLREAAAAAALRSIEAEERNVLRQELDQLTETFRREEAEIAERRAGMTKEDFDERVRDFDRRVRAARQQAQENSVAFQNRFAEAFAALEKEVGPVIAALLEERGAHVALDRRSVLFVRQAADVTQEVIRRLDALVPAAVARDLLPPMPAPR